jgi:RNA polymerase sigma-70 factor (ECF subfamily)
LAQVARQHAIKAWKATRPTSSDPLPDLPTEPPQDSPLEEHLDQALHSLDVEDRQTIEWHYFDNLSHKEIADRLGTTAKAVSSRLERARARIRTIVQKLLSHET